MLYPSCARETKFVIEQNNIVVPLELLYRMLATYRTFGMRDKFSALVEMMSAVGQPFEEDRLCKALCQLTSDLSSLRAMAMEGAADT